MDTTQLSFAIAFFAGLASFLSPCVLPLVPIYVAQLVGESVHQSAEQPGYFTHRLSTFLHAGTFVLGFSIAFVALGATASALGSFLHIYQFVLRQAGGILLIALGLYMTGILKLPFLYQQKRFKFYPSRPSYPASLLMGIIFAIAWTPCIGPILGSILVLAAGATTLRQGVILLLFYAIGLGVPFLLLGLSLDRLSLFLKRLRPYLGKIEFGTGIFMMLMGVLIFFQLLPYLNHYFNVGPTF